jgi:hypothetical protein
MQIPSKTSAVEKEQYLFVSIEGGSNPFDEPLRQQPATSYRFLFYPAIDHLDGCQRPTVGTFR